MKKINYWEECIQLGAEECGLTLTNEQVNSLAQSAQASHENYGLAFYSPSSNDRLDEINREWEQKFKTLKSDFEKYRNDAETAVKKALGQRNDSLVDIGENGQVVKYEGRTTILQ